MFNKYRIFLDTNDNSLKYKEVELTVNEIESLLGYIWDKDLIKRVMDFKSKMEFKSKEGYIRDRLEYKLNKINGQT